MEFRTDKAEWAVEFLDLEEAAQVEVAQWEPFQIAFLNNDTRFGADVKARQIAWSFTSAVDAVVDGILEPGTPHIFVSINLDEATEKIRYARSVIAALDDPVRPTLVRDTRLEIEFANGSRLISHPCRPPRGKPRARIYLDEMAHYKAGLDREIYTAALPATVKGDGYIRVGSSPLGAKGLFWEIVTESTRTYPGYAGWRRFIPWWEVRALCKDTRTARLVAPEMTTQERVHALGTKALVEIFENLLLEDFQQEYECAWVDESTAWIPWEIIKRNQDPDLTWWHVKDINEAVQVVVEIREAISKGLVELAFAGGIDVGRRRNLTEFIAVGKSTAGRMPLRLMASLDRMKYDEQEACLLYLINNLPFTSVLVDRNGIGNQLAENLERSGRVEGVDFTQATKELWAVQIKIEMERSNVPIPMQRELAYQIHSIKRLVTPAKNSVFDTERNEKHHADKFWALALAVWAGSDVGKMLTRAPAPAIDWRG